MAGDDSKQSDSKPVAFPGGDTAGSDSVFHRGNFMEGHKTSVQKIKNLDVINEMELPSSWGRFEQTSAMGHCVVFRRSKYAATQISFLERGRSLDEGSADAFKNIVNSQLPTPRTLYSQNTGADAHSQAIFKTLASALGSNLVGDNQLTSPLTATDARRPAFHLDSARVETLNGKHVIAIQGWFTQLDERAEIKMAGDGPAKRYYSGIFFDAGAGGGKVDEMYLMADDKASFLSSKTIFRSATKSIKWR